MAQGGVVVEGGSAPGLSLIVGYKLTKAAVQLLAGLAVFVLPRSDVRDVLIDLAAAVLGHFTGAWSLVLARALVRVETAQQLELVAVALVADGVLSFVEGWSLHRRYAWGRWLVIGATSSLLPLEAIELFRRHSPGRAAILVVNLAIVAYLVRRRIGRPATTR